MCSIPLPAVRSPGNDGVAEGRLVNLANWNRTTGTHSETQGLKKEQETKNRKWGRGERTTISTLVQRGVYAMCLDAGDCNSQLGAGEMSHAHEFARRCLSSLD